MYTTLKVLDKSESNHQISSLLSYFYRRYRRHCSTTAINAFEDDFFNLSSIVAGCSAETFLRSLTCLERILILINSLGDRVIAFLALGLLGAASESSNAFSVSIFVVEGKAFKDFLVIARICRLQKLFNVDSELNGITRGTGSQVVLASLKTLFPCIEVHRCHFAEVRFSHVNIETLRLTNVRSTGDCAVEESPLRNLPNGLV